MSQDLVSSPSQITNIPISELVIPPWNPRKVKTEWELADLEAYVKNGGLVPRILVWGGDGKSVISGQRRLEVYERLGKTQIEAEILDIPLEEARKLAITSNEGAPLHWLDKYESWEPYLAAGQGLTDDQAAATVGVAKTWIWRAKKLLGVLTPTSRRLIREHLAQAQVEGDTKNKGDNDIPQSLENDAETLKNRISENSEKWQLLEVVAFQLTALWEKRSLDDAQALAEKAMPVILSREMTGPQVKGLVEWVKGGNSPETYKASETSQKGEREKGNGSGQATAAKANQQPGEEAYSGTEVASSSTPAYSAGIPCNDSGNYDMVQGSRNDSNGQNAALKAGGFLGVLGGLLTGLFARRISNQGGLAGGIKTFILQNLKRALGTMARRWMLHGLAAIGVIFFFGPHLFTSLYHSAFGYGDSKPKATQAAQTASLVPVGSNAGPSDLAPVKPFNLDQGRLESDSTIVQDFARDYYGADYSSTTSWIANLNSPLAPDYSQAFFHDLCPPSWIEILRKRKLLEDFHTTGPVRVLGADPNGEDLLVEGNAVWKSDLHQWGKVLAKGPVALEVHVAHLPGDTSAGKIGWVKEITSLPVPGITSHGQTSTGAQKVNGINKGQNSYPVSTSVSNNNSQVKVGSSNSQGTTASVDDTVKTIGDTVDTADKAKKLFGF